MKALKILGVLHLVLAVAHLVFVLFAPWVKRNGVSYGIFDKDGAAGFGIIALILAVILVLLAIMRLLGRTKVLPGLGVEQLTVVCGTAATLNMISFVVGWKAVFPGSTGWAVPAAYFSGSLIPQIGLLTVSAAEPARGIAPLADARRRSLSLLVLVAGLGVFIFPFLSWLRGGGVSLSTFTSLNAENTISGPRFGYLLITLGAAVVVAAAMRLRPQGLAEPGPNMLLSHALFGVGVVCTLVPLATLLSVLRLKGVNAGVGLWLALIAGLVLIAAAVTENKARQAVAV
jgi:hypothetical protein